MQLPIYFGLLAKMECKSSLKSQLNKSFLEREYMRTLFRNCLFLILVFTYGIVNARVYMCEDENGHKTATDSACKPTDKKRVVQMRITETESSGLYANSDSGSSQRSTRDPKCAELLSQLEGIRFSDNDLHDVEAMVAKKNNRTALTNEYEIRCMSTGDHQARSAEREQNKSNAQMQRQMRQIQNTQQEIQNRQRGIGY